MVRKLLFEQAAQLCTAPRASVHSGAPTRKGKARDRQPVNIIDRTQSYFVDSPRLWDSPRLDSPNKPQGSPPAAPTLIRLVYLSGSILRGGSKVVFTVFNQGYHKCAHKNSPELPGGRRWIATRLALRGLIGIAILLRSGSAIFRQTNAAEIRGVVKDLAGGVLPGVTLVAEHSASGFRLERLSDSAGKFLFPALPVGEYTISARASGFKRYSQNGVTLQNGQIIRLEIALTSGDITEEINITDAEPPLRTTSAEISEVIEHQRVVGLPLNGCYFSQLALLSGGVIKPPGGARGAARQQAGDLVNVAGQRSGHNIDQLDGVKITDEYFNNMVVNPSVDAIQEFKILKSMYAAEFGGKASAPINVATKSGTNAFHGTLFEFLRNGVFDAKNVFDDPRKPIPPFQQNQFGGALGAPATVPGIYEGKNQTFFFTNYEGQRKRRRKRHGPRLSNRIQRGLEP
jgi:hypothetical protein